MVFVLNPTCYLRQRGAHFQLLGKVDAIIAPPSRYKSHVSSLRPVSCPSSPDLLRAAPGDGHPVSLVCRRSAASLPGAETLRWWPLPITTKYYTAVLDLWEVSHDRLVAGVQGDQPLGISSSESQKQEDQRSPSLSEESLAVVKELLHDTQALILVFDACRPETFHALQPWGEILLQLQEAASSASGRFRGGPAGGGGDGGPADNLSPPEVCLCVGNSVLAQTAGGKDWQRVVSEANGWCIDHGLELVTLAHGQVGAEHPVECELFVQ